MFKVCHIEFEHPVETHPHLSQLTQLAKSAVSPNAPHTLLSYTQYGPIMNGGVEARDDAAICYRTILRVTRAITE